MGATCNDHSTGGQWGLVEARQHINALELKAAYLAIQPFLGQMNQPPRHILLEMDNTAAVAYNNKREERTLQPYPAKPYRYGDIF